MSRAGPAASSSRSGAAARAWCRCWPATTPGCWPRRGPPGPGWSAAAPIEVMLPIGVRRRQLKVRTLLAGMCLAHADHRPAHLTRVHQALTALSEGEQRRLGVIADWKNGPHQLTYRQTERTFGLVN